MSIERVKAYFKQWNIQDRVIEHFESCATVAEAALAIGTEEQRIAKTLSFQLEDQIILIVAAGDTKIDNKKYKAAFGLKAAMLKPEEVLSKVGYPVGGVCPFGINPGIDVYLDRSLKRFQTVFPACGSSNSMIELTIDELKKYSGYTGWVDVCKGWEN